MTEKLYRSDTLLEWMEKINSIIDGEGNNNIPLLSFDTLAELLAAEGVSVDQLVMIKNDGDNTGMYYWNINKWEKINDPRITGAAQKSNNLSDLTNKATARNNLQLGSAATKDVGESVGNVMGVGAFGLGGAGRQLDKDAVYEKGAMFGGYGTQASSPFPVSCNVLHMGQSHRYQAQFGISLGDSGGGVYVRRHVTGEWLPPQEILTSVSSIPFSKLTGVPPFAKNWNELGGKPTSFPPSAHTHKWSDITSGVPDYAKRWAKWDEIGNVPTSFPPSAHTHKWGDITSGVPDYAKRWANWSEVGQKPTIFPTNWGNVAEKPSTFPSTWGSVTGKPNTFPTTWNDVQGKPSTFPASVPNERYAINTYSLLQVGMNGDANLVTRDVSTGTYTFKGGLIPGTWRLMMRDSGVHTVNYNAGGGSVPYFYFLIRIA